MRHPLILLAACPVALISCSGNIAEEMNGASEEEIITIYASSEAEPEVKNVIDDATLEIDWVAGDAINVFFGASESSRFVTSESGQIAQFKGSIDVVTGGGEGLTDETSLWGIYPYDEDNTCDGSYITLSVPAVQEAAENTFANGLFPQIARSRNFYMTFYNLCGCFKFCVENPDIRYVTLSGVNGEYIAGRARVAMEDRPAVDEIISGETKLTMYAPDGGYFTPGVYYYFVLYPTTFSGGLTLTYYKDDTYAVYTYPNSYSLGRSVVSRFTNRDAGLTFEPITLNDWEDGENVKDEI